jgi:hypothetical protein
MSHCLHVPSRRNPTGDDAQRAQQTVAQHGDLPFRSTQKADNPAMTRLYLVLLSALTLLLGSAAAPRPLRGEIVSCSG